MPKYTKPEQIADNLRQSHDPSYYAHVYGLMGHALGQKYSMHRPGSWANVGEIPDYPDILPQFYELGTSNRLMTNAALMMFKTCYMDPQPDFPDLDGMSEAIRQAILVGLWRKKEWANEAHKTFLDGDNLGIGWTQVGALGGEVDIVHHPVYNVIWDRHMWGAGKCRYIAFVHHMPVEKAMGMFGSSIKKHASEFAPWNTDFTTPLKRVKIIEYFDYDLEGSEPTHAYFLNNIGGETLDIGPNEYECIPAAFYQHIHFWAMRRPIGSLDLQLAGEEMRSALFKYIKLMLERGSGFDVVDTSRLEPDALEDWKSGKLLPLIPITGAGDKNIAQLHQRVPAQDIPAGVYNFLQILDRESASQSGNSEADRANPTSGQRTLGEINTIQQGSDIQTQWRRRQWARYLERLFEKVVKVAGKFHVQPLLVDVEKRNVLLNDPENPSSAIEVWLQEPSRINVNEDTLVHEDASIKAQRQITLWMPFLQDPYMRPLEVRKKVLEAMGEKEPERYMLTEQELIAQQEAQAAVEMAQMDTQAQSKQPAKK